MTTEAKTGMPIHTILSVDRPDQVASQIINNPASSPYCIALDLQRSKLCAGDAVEWIGKFNQEFAFQGEHHGYRGAPLPVAVFADSFTERESIALQDVGAVLFDRSLSSNADCQTSEELAKRIDQVFGGQTAQAYVQAPETPPRQKALNDEDRKAANSYPDGRSAADVEYLLKIMNERSAPSKPSPQR